MKSITASNKIYRFSRKIFKNGSWQTFPQSNRRDWEFPLQYFHSNYVQSPRQQNTNPRSCGHVSKEVAERIAAPHGSKTYGILSVLMQAYYKAEYLFTVNENVFTPPPKVKSGVIRLTRFREEIEGVPYAFFLNLVKTGFNQRRKKLSNALKSLNQNELLSTLKYKDLRAEQLSVEDFIDLAKILYAEKE